MRLDYLIKREEFASNFEKTFNKFLLEAYKSNYSVKWKRGFSSNNCLLVNSKLNAIYSRNIDRADLKKIVSEYSYHQNFLRRLLQSAYIKLASNVYFEWLFIKNRVEIKPWYKGLDRLCIVPGNHSIRFINLESSSCKVLLKDEFDRDFITNEVNLRKEYTFLSTPKLLNIDPDCFWFEEEQISALPLNRIASQEIKTQALLEAQNNLSALYSKSLETVNLKSYLHALFEYCCFQIHKLSDVYTSEDKEKIKATLDLLNENIVIKGGHDIDIVQSHGDFQSANILVNISDKKVYLIDWEYSKKRSIFYDALVFETNARSPKGFANRLKAILHKENNSWYWYKLRKDKKISISQLNIFLIEDLIVRLDELKIVNLINKDDGLSIWLDEVNRYMTDL